MRIALAALAVLAGCPAPQPPRPLAVALAIDVTRERGAPRGVAADERAVYVATTVGAQTVIEARPIAAPARAAWSRTLDGGGGPLARSGALLGASLASTGTAGGLALRGNPGAVLVALDAATGAPRWTLAIDASEWSLVTALAAAADGFVVGGSFAGTLRAADRVVSSAGKADGFVALVASDGAVRWLVRVGGAHADGVHGVAALGDRIAIAGTCAAGAELLGEPLVATDERSPRPDVFVAELAAPTGTRTWSASFGGKLDDSVAGIALDARGRIAVATVARSDQRINLADVVVSGSSDGLVTYFALDGTAGPTLVLGGLEAGAPRAIAASGDRIVVAGVYRGTLSVGRRSLTAAGEDAFAVVLDGGRITRLEPIAGPGREEPVALAATPGGFVVAVAHTAGATIGELPVAAPADPMTGAAVAIRPAP